MKIVGAIIASLCIAVPHGSAIAHGDHKARHGGDMGRGSDEVVVEFVMDKGTLKVYVTDDAGKPLDLQRMRATLTVSPPQGPAKAFELTPAGADQLVAKGAAPRRGDRLNAVFVLPTGEQLQSLTLFSQ